MVHRILKTLLLTTCMTMICLSVGCHYSKSADTLARKGILDLSGVDLPNVNPIRLDGAWELYWMQLLTPQDFLGTQAPIISAYLTLPTSWNHVKIKGNSVGSTGYATLRLKVIPNKGNHVLALQLGEIHSAYKLWANGVLLVENGVVGKNAAREIPGQTISQALVHSENKPVELVLQVSNFHHREGGVVSSIKLGAPKKLEKTLLKQWALALLLVGSLLVMGIYHIGLYCIRRKDRAPLYFGIYSLLWAGSAFTSSATDWAVNLVVQNYPASFINRVDLICFVISLPIGYAFFRTLYPHEFSRRLQQITALVSLVFTGLGLALPTLAFTIIVPAIYYFSMAMIAYCLIMLFRAMIKGREAASLILAGFFAVGAAGINDMLCDLQLIRSTYLIHLGMFVFIFFQAMVLSLRFSKSFHSVEQLSNELSDKNRALEDEMSERNRLEREIIRISEDERRRISHDLHDGLCQLLTGARLHFSALARKLSEPDRYRQEMAEVVTLLEKSVNHAYDLSRGLWPVEHDNNTLSPSLEELCRQLSESSSIAIEFKQSRGCQDCANEGVTQLYRIAQEALTNAVKHARAGRIVVTLTCQDRENLSLSVHDNGVGRNAAVKSTGGMGMGIMAHRAKLIGGKLVVSDAEDGGTLVSCTVPCDNQLTEEHTA
jgi:signal transduction histidine kinase